MWEGVAGMRGERERERERGGDGDRGEDRAGERRGTVRI